ncbi:MAG: hypothetical protein AAAFM81_09740 [Pseudomonadota bacterium]
MPKTIAGIIVIAAIALGTGTADAHPGHDRYDRDDRRVERRIDRAELRAYRRAEQRYRECLRRYQRIHNRHYRKYYRGYRYGVVPKSYRRHALAHTCDKRFRQFLRGHAYFGAREAYLLGDTRRKRTYRVYDD